MVLLVGLVAIWVEPASLAQSSDVTKPPPILKQAGQFSAAQLNRPPLIDGREWIAANVADDFIPWHGPGANPSVLPHVAGLRRSRRRFRPLPTALPTRTSHSGPHWHWIHWLGVRDLRRSLYRHGTRGTCSTCGNGSSMRCLKLCTSRTTRRLRLSRATASVSSSREETARSIAKMCVSNTTSSLGRRRTAVDPP